MNLAVELLLLEIGHCDQAALLAHVNAVRVRLVKQSLLKIRKGGGRMGSGQELRERVHVGGPLVRRGAGTDSSVRNSHMHDVRLQSVYLEEGRRPMTDDAVAFHLAEPQASVPRSALHWLTGQDLSGWVEG